MIFGCSNVKQIKQSHLDVKKSLVMWIHKALKLICMSTKFLASESAI